MKPTDDERNVAADRRKNKYFFLSCKPVEKHSENVDANCLEVTRSNRRFPLAPLTSACRKGAAFGRRERDVVSPTRTAV